MRKTLLLLAMAMYLVTPLSGQNGDWISLFDGKSLNGWTIQSGSAKYHIEHEEIVGTSVPNSPNTFLCTDQIFSDFILEFEVYLVHTELNSGVQFRSNLAEEEMVFWYRDGQGKLKQRQLPEGRVYGYQVEIASEEGGASGGVYDEARRAIMIYGSAPREVAKNAFKDHQWNRYRVECRGNSIRTFINDVPCADFMDDMTKSGFIGLQVHGVGEETTPYQVKWRNIRIMEL